jgi:enolase
MIKEKLKKITAREVLDSRGNPALEVIAYSDNECASAIVPSGASTGIYEALELRDNDKRYHGMGLKKAIKNVDFISKKLVKEQIDISNIKKIDEFMIKLDGTVKKTKLGANSILGVSMAMCRLASKIQKKPLYLFLAQLFGNKNLYLPLPFCNVINGGKHAGNNLAMQEFMIVPIKAKSFSIATQMVCETYHELKSLIKKKYGADAINVGDEGGFAPPIKKAEEALDLITKAINNANYNGKIAIALDPAASEFYNNSKKKYIAYKKFNAKELTDYYLKLANKYNIISIEDPFDQDDFDGFSLITKKAKFQIVGDDLLVTSPDRIKIALEKKLCNALLLKINQIGTISQAMDAAKLAMDNKWKVMVSHRSGETEDSFISDLAVSLGCGQIKLGAPCRSDRTAKYNQLIRIEEELGTKAKLKKF